MALEPAGALPLASGGGCTRGLDRVGRSAELVCGDMRHRCGLAGSICGVPSSSAQLSCRSLGMASRIAGLRHLDLAARPCPGMLNRLAGPRVRGLHRLEQVQNMLCARGCLQSQEPVVGVRERPPAADGDEAGVAVFGEDHGCTRPVASAQRLSLPAAG
jgi:hypothetical protein